MTSPETSPSYADGGCLCGALRYRVFGKPLVSSVCHCRSCRLASGAPAVGWIAFHVDDVHLLRGRPATRHSSPQVVRGFCARCGTPVSYRHADTPDVIELTTATLDHPELCPPTREVWLEHRVGWQPVDPARTQHRHGSAEPPADRPGE
ncbi:MAG TPA: GFA family protein [Albitalea sp.]